MILSPEELNITRNVVLEFKAQGAADFAIGQSLGMFSSFHHAMTYATRWASTSHLVWNDAANEASLVMERTYYALHSKGTFLVKEVRETSALRSEVLSKSEKEMTGGFHFVVTAHTLNSDHVLGSFPSFRLAEEQVRPVFDNGNGAYVFNLFLDGENTWSTTDADGTKYIVRMEKGPLPLTPFQKAEEEYRAKVNAEAKVYLLKVQAEERAKAEERANNALKRKEEAEW